MSLDTHLDSLEHSGLIQLAQLEPEIEYLFRHALVQDATYESTLKQERRGLHRAVAEALEAAYPDRGDEMAATLAHHYDRAGDMDQAVIFYTRAGDAAFRQYANCEAESHYGAALGLVVDDLATSRDTLLHLFERKGRALELMGEVPSAAEVYEQMERIGQERGDETIILHALMAQALLQVTPSPVFNPEQGFEIAVSALRLARDLRDRPAEARALWILALGYGYGRGDRGEAIWHGKQALAIARELGLTELIAFLQTDLANIYGPSLKVEESIDSLTEAIASWRMLGNIPMLTFALNSISQSHVMKGQFQDAVTTTRESLTLAESIENGLGIGYASSQLSEALAMQGYVGEALHIAEAGMRRALAMGAPAMAHHGRARLALFYSAMGASAQARAILTSILEEINASPVAPVVVINLLVITGRVIALCGEVPGAEQLQDRVGEVFSRSDDEPSARLFVGTQRASLALVRGEYVEALSILDDIVDLLKQLEAWGQYPELQLHRARAMSELGRHVEAYEALAEARNVAERTGATLILWRVLAQLAELEAERGNEELADTMRHEARSIVQFIADGLDDPGLRAGFLAMPEVRALIRGGSAT